MTIFKRVGRDAATTKQHLTLDDWRDFAGPKDVSTQWQDGYETGGVMPIGTSDNRERIVGMME